VKILRAHQIKELDAYTIAHEPVAAIDLMERAATALAEWVYNHHSFNTPCCIIAGPGNNGGDGLALARLLHASGYPVRVVLCLIGTSRSSDCQVNLDRLQRLPGISIHHLQDQDTWPEIQPAELIIDALFGYGINRPITGYWADFINYLNALPNRRLAIDIPSGMFPDGPSSGTSFQANDTLSFETPKFAFFFPENQQRTGRFHLLLIGLHQAFLASLSTPHQYIDQAIIRDLLRPRRTFDHKGTHGHALLMVGSQGKMGAAVLAARAAIRSGVGLLSLHIPATGNDVLQTAVPEAMTFTDNAPLPDVKSFKAIGAGCGWGQSSDKAALLRALISSGQQRLVLDADALNLLAQSPEWLAHLPEGSILTPHLKEFERLFGPSANSFERHALQRSMAEKYRIIIVLKGAFTCIASPDGAWFNSTGNPGMAKGGSGDVLTGLLTGLLARAYPPIEAAILGVYLHGLAGDLAAEKHNMEAMCAGDIIGELGAAFKAIYKEYND
jgi:ADP-dependent NAD(P)H-hydrate dehydratase / NAD(P)H-hydrate epimerase